MKGTRCPTTLLTQRQTASPWHRCMGAQAACRVRCCRPAASLGERGPQCPKPRPLISLHPLIGLLSAGSVVLSSGLAFGSEKVGEFQASGFIFKDSVETVAIEDPEVQGVTIYISDFKRSLPDKLKKNFFSEPSQASVTCAITGPVAIKDESKVRGPDGNEVFSERKGLNLFQNKTLRVRRLYDEPHNTLLYIAYSTRLTSGQVRMPHLRRAPLWQDDDKISSGRYRTSVCALPISPLVTPATQ